MVCRLDHLTVIAPSLELGAAYVEASLGVAPETGRVHANMGTHNRLLALGPSVYLEVIAKNPQADAVTRPCWFGLDQVTPDSAPRLAAWVASTDDIAGAADSQLGDIETMYRESHRWQMTVRPDGSPPLDGAAPLLIQRAPGANPVAALTQTGLSLQRLRIQHPDPDQVLAVLARISLAAEPVVAVERGDKVQLIAEIGTPSGLRRLGDA